jgi:hypothetical protein
MRSPVERAFPNRISHMAMIDRLELAIVRDYDESRVALRARCEQLNISRLEIDRLSGLPNGYASTVLSNAPRKRIGPANIGPMLADLGLALVVVEDAEAMARYTARAEPRMKARALLTIHNARRATARESSMFKPNYGADRAARRLMAQARSEDNGSEKKNPHNAKPNARQRRRHPARAACHCRLDVKRAWPGTGSCRGCGSDGEIHQPGRRRSLKADYAARRAAAWLRLA